MSVDESEARLRALKGEGQKKTETAGDLPTHGVGYERPADRFAAEQAALVDPRRVAFQRLALAPEHVAHLPEELRMSGRDESPAPKARARYEAVDERPTPDYEMPRFRGLEPLKPARLHASEDEEG